MQVIKPDSDFEQVSGQVIREFDVITIGVYAKLLSFGKNWNLNIKGLSKALKLSIDKTRKAITELESAGFIVRKAIYNGNKLKGWEYTIYGNCVEESERSKAGFSVSQNQTTLKSDNTENDQDNNNIFEDNNILKRNNKNEIYSLGTTLPSSNNPINTQNNPHPKVAATPSPKVQYAEFVKMTEKEYKSLVSVYGEKITNEFIKILDNYKGSSGKTYKNDYRAILTWVVDRYKKDHNIVTITPTDDKPRWMKLGYPSEEAFNNRFK